MSPSGDGGSHRDGSPLRPALLGGGASAEEVAAAQEVLRIADLRTPDAGGDTEARVALATALRRVIVANVASQIDDEDISAAAHAIEEVADRLEAASGPGRRARFQPDPSGPAQDFFPTSPVTGVANPLAPPVRVQTVDGEIHGTAWFDHQYEGPPTCVHGGVIALVFDEVLGSANILSGSPGMTGTLSVRYRRPTPTRTDLTVRGRFVKQEGRRVYTWGAIYRGDEITAEAEGIFVQVPPDRLLSIIQANPEA
jgi:acyl-coenzyme A thioesterase PaaI-like protein